MEKNFFHTLCCRMKKYHAVYRKTEFSCPLLPTLAFVIHELSICQSTWMGTGGRKNRVERDPTDFCRPERKVSSHSALPDLHDCLLHTNAVNWSKLHRGPLIVQFGTQEVGRSCTKQGGSHDV